jgi:hypothetical protein
MFLKNVIPAEREARRAGIPLSTNGDYCMLRFLAGWVPARRFAPSGMTLGACASGSSSSDSKIHQVETLGR